MGLIGSSSSSSKQQRQAAAASSGKQQQTVASSGKQQQAVASSGKQQRPLPRQRPRHKHNRKTVSLTCLPPNKAPLRVCWGLSLFFGLQHVGHMS